MDGQISKEWLVGFIEGEGNFHVALINLKKNRPNYHFDYYPVLQFRIFLREDDINVLEDIKTFLGFGSIYKKNMDSNRRRGFKARDQCAYYVSHSKDLIKLKEILLSCKFFTKKAKDKDIFFKILDLKLNKKHLVPEGYAEIVALAKSMNSQAREDHKIKNIGS